MLQEVNDLPRALHLGSGIVGEAAFGVAESMDSGARLPSVRPRGVTSPLCFLVPSSVRGDNNSSWFTELLQRLKES